VVARVTTYEGQVSPDLDGVRMYDETALPWLQDAEGFRGLLVLVDRANERTVSLSFWENEELERQSQQARRRFGELVAEHIGLKREEGEIYEVVLGRGVHLDAPLA
jgi:heme-degrading monooxygenase HmoA